MAVTVVTEFTDKATIRVIAYIHDDDDTLTDPTAATVDISDPDGTLQVDGEAMSSSETGIYTYYYHKGAGEAVMAKGRWRGEVLIADGLGADAVYSAKTFSFKVI